MGCVVNNCSWVLLSLCLIEMVYDNELRVLGVLVGGVEEMLLFFGSSKIVKKCLVIILFWIR